jgi:WD40 repeat protein
MKIATKNRPNPWLRWGTLALLCAAAGIWSFGSNLASRAAEDEKPSAADEVKELQKKYEAEHDAVTGSDRAKVLSPDAIKQAEELAKKGKAALKAGRVMQAKEAFQQARWVLPMLPPDLPKNVVRVFGNSKLRHANEVRGLAYSKDGKRLATASDDGTVRIWDVANGKLLLTYLGHNDYVRAVAFSPDGTMIASGGGGRDVRVWNSKTGKDIQTLKGPEKKKEDKDKEDYYVISVAFNKDASQVATGGSDETVRIFEVKSGDLKKTLATGRTRLEGVAFSPDGKQLAVAVSDGVVQIWDTAAYNLMVGFQPHNTCYGVAFTPDGQNFVSWGPEGAKMFTAPQAGRPDLNPNAGNPKKVFPAGDKSSCQSAAIGKDSKLLAMGCADNIVRVFDMDTKEALFTFQDHTDKINDVAFNPVGGELASASADHTVRLWHFDTVQQARDLTGHKGPVWSAAISKDGQHVVSGGADRTVKIWESSGGKPLHTLKEHKSAVTTVLYSPDDKQILSCGGDKVLRLWDAKSGELIRTFKGHTGTVTSVAFSPTGKRIVSGGADKLVIIWDTEKGDEILTFKDNKAVVAAVAFSSDGKQVASGSVDQNITVWDAKAGGKPTAQWNGHGAAVSALAYSPDGDWLASCGADQLVKVWKTTNLGNNPNPIVLSGHTGPVSSVAFSSNSQMLVSAGSDQLVRLWKLEPPTGKEIRSFRGHKDWISSVCFSKGGHYVVSASVDQTVKVWEITSREAGTPAEHAGEVAAIAVSPNGKLLASGAADHAIKIWDLKTGSLLHTLNGHIRGVSSLVFTPDSKTLISGGAKEDQTIRLWDVTTGKEIPKNETQQASFTNLINYIPALGLTKDGKNLFVWLPGTNRGKESYSQIDLFELATGKRLLGEKAFTDKGRVVNCLSFSADGKKAAMGADDGSVRVFDISADKIEPENGGDWPVHQKGVGDMVFTPDAKILVTGGKSGTIKIWNVTDRKTPAKTIKTAHKLPVAMLAMSPDGKHFASGSFDNTIKVWDTAKGTLVRNWEFKYPEQTSNTFIRNLAFTPDGKHLVTANADTTLYMLALPE